MTTVILLQFLWVRNQGTAQLGLFCLRVSPTAATGAGVGGKGPVRAAATPRLNWGRIRAQAHSRGCQPGWASCWLLASGCPQFMATCHKLLPTLGQLVSSEQASEEREREGMSLGHHLRGDMPSLCHILFVRSKSLGPASLKGRRWVAGSEGLRESFYLFIYLFIYLFTVFYSRPCGTWRFPG